MADLKPDAATLTRIGIDPEKWTNAYLSRSDGTAASLSAWFAAAIEAGRNTPAGITGTMHLIDEGDALVPRHAHEPLPADHPANTGQSNG
jgi:LPS sulfotransferase NodH